MTTLYLIRHAESVANADNLLAGRIDYPLSPTGKLDAAAIASEFAAKFAIGEVPRPPHWSGFRVLPKRIEFWRDRPFRLHDRLEFTRAAGGQPWTTQRLYP